MLRRVVWLLLPALLIPGAILGAPAELHVAAASSCAPALTEIGQAFEKQGSAHVVFSFGSSGLLARQISHGAPFDVFVAAEPAPVDALIRSGDADAKTRAVFARGALDLWWRADLPAPPTRLADLAQPLEAFFSAVMVKCEDPALRATRLSLLHRLRQAFLRVADFSLWQ